MVRFSDLKIQSTQKFNGDSIKIAKIFNREISIKDYVIEPSKFEGKGDRLKLHFDLDGESHITFTGSKNLIKYAKQFPRDRFPIITTIVKSDEYYEFT